MTQEEAELEQVVINAQIDRLMVDFRLPYSCSSGCGYPVPTPGPCGECFGST